MDFSQIQSSADRKLYDRTIASALAQFKTVPRPCGDTEVMTASGRRFDLLHPLASDVDPNDIIHSLARSARFTGHNKHLFVVSQHSCNVRMLCSDEAKGPGGLHDVLEAYIGDDSSPKKRAVRILAQNEPSALDVLGQRINVQIHARFGLDYPLPEHIKNEVALFDQVAMHFESKALLPEPVCANPLTGWFPDEAISQIEQLLRHDEQPVELREREFAAALADDFPSIAGEITKYLGDEFTPDTERARSLMSADPNADKNPDRTHDYYEPSL